MRAQIKGPVWGESWRERTKSSRGRTSKVDEKERMGEGGGCTACDGGSGGLREMEG